MSAPPLITKLYFPALRRNLIPRPRLERKLSETLARRLTLVSAPPGFGKTSLVAAWVHDIKEGMRKFDDGHPGISSNSLLAGWLHLDEDDNDAVRFFTYLVAALQRLDANLCLGIQSQLAGPLQPPVEALVTLLVNDLLEKEQHIVLILDDYHRIHSETIHKAIIHLIEQQPDNTHLIVITREDPPFPLPRLRARNEMIEIREQDLRFSIQEAADFLALTMGLKVSEEAVTTLTNRTEGWIAGLQMAGLSLQDCTEVEGLIAGFSGHDRYILDYLMEEVVQRQPAQVQDFLLRTSILSSLCASLCDELLIDDRSVSPLSTSFSSSQEIIEYLERSNLFTIPLDHKREWYRYHHLFADLLSYRLKRQYPEQLPLLHKRAYSWYISMGDMEEAMRHALAIPDYMLAADLAEGYLQQMIRSSHIASCLNWIQHLPSEVIRSRPYLCVSCAWVYILSGDFEAVSRYLEDSRLALENYEPVYSPVEQRWITQEEVRGNALAIQAYWARLRGDFAQTISLSQQALQELPVVASETRCVVALTLGMVYLAIGKPEMAQKALTDAYEMGKGSRGNLFVAVTALCQLAGLAVWRCNLGEAERLCHQAIEIGTIQSEKQISSPAVAYAHGWLAAVHNQRNEDAAARNHIERVFESVERVGPMETKIYARLFQSRLALDAGNFLEAGRLLKWVEERIQGYPAQGPVKTEWIVNRGRLFLENGEITGAFSWLASQGVNASDLAEGSRNRNDPQRIVWTRLPEYLLLARVLLAKGEFPQAELLLDRICNAAETWQYIEVYLEALVLLAVTTAVSSRSPQTSTQAINYLEQALRMGNPEGYIRPFLLAGESLVRLLRQAIIHDIYPAYANELLKQLYEHLRVASVRKPTVARQSDISTRTTAFVEPVTEREGQMLRLLAAGLSSTEIANELILSVHTTRSYIKSLYRKLDVHGRVEAVEKGRQLGLL